MHRRVRLIVACAVASLLLAPAAVTPAASLRRGIPGPPDFAAASNRRLEFRTEAWTSGLGIVSSFAFLPDGRALVAEKGGFSGAGVGRVVLVSANGRTASEALRVPVCADAERGLVGLTVDPQFARTRFVYVFYTRRMAGCYSGQIGEVPPRDKQVVSRVSRFTLDGRVIDPKSEKVLLDGIPAYQSGHNGGGLRFGGDGTLFVGTGNAQLDARNVSQDLDALSGKILRIDPRKPSVAPAGNPFARGERSAARPRNLVWAYGFRNPFGFDLDPRTGLLMAGDVGSDPPTAAEEVNRVAPGANYGWPLVEGSAYDRRFTDPVASYAHGQCISIIGGTIVRGAALGPDLEGSFLVGDFGCGRIWSVDPDGGVGGVAFLASVPGYITHLESGPAGVPYVSTAQGVLYQIRPATNTLDVD